MSGEETEAELMLRDINRRHHKLNDWNMVLWIALT